MRPHTQLVNLFRFSSEESEILIKFLQRQTKGKLRFVHCLLPLKWNFAIPDHKCKHFHPISPFALNFHKWIQTFWRAWHTQQTSLTCAPSVSWLWSVKLNLLIALMEIAPDTDPTCVAAVFSLVCVFYSALKEIWLAINLYSWPRSDKQSTCKLDGQFSPTRTEVDVVKRGRENKLFIKQKAGTETIPVYRCRSDCSRWLCFFVDFRGFYRVCC